MYVHDSCNQNVPELIRIMLSSSYIIYDNLAEAIASSKACSARFIIFAKKRIFFYKNDMIFLFKKSI